MVELIGQRIGILAEHLFDDVGHLHALKNLAIGATAGQPEPGSELCRVQGVDALATNHGEARADAVEVARRLLLFGLDMQRHALT